MLPFRYLAVLAFVGCAFAQEYEYSASPRPAPSRVQPGYSGPSAPRAAPVAILKQINRHNEDGSYTYGYESADGSFKIETKLPNGEVKGKYGYADDTGKLRVVEYGATKFGFQPVGEGITVAPPTLVDETTSRDGTLLPEYSGAYYDEEPQQPVRAAPRPISRPRPQPSFEGFGGPQQFSPASQRSAGPVPPRAQIPGAAPASTSFNLDFGPPSQPAPVRSYAPAPRPSYSRPAPIEEDYNDPAPSQFRNAPAPSQFRNVPAPSITYSPQPAPSRHTQAQFEVPRPAPQYAPRPAPSPAGRSSGGILDQLSKEYALPQGGAAPLHDISFGYY